MVLFKVKWTITEAELITPPFCSSPALPSHPNIVTSGSEGKTTAKMPDLRFQNDLVLLEGLWRCEAGSAFSTMENN